MKKSDARIVAWPRLRYCTIDARAVHHPLIDLRLFDEMNFVYPSITLCPLKGPIVRAPSWASMKIKMFDVLPCVIRLLKVGWCALLYVLGKSLKSLSIFQWIRFSKLRMWWVNRMNDDDKNILQSKFYLKRLLWFSYRLRNVLFHIEQLMLNW